MPKARAKPDPAPADFDETSPPPKRRPPGVPVPRAVTLRPHEPVAETFAAWDAQGQVPPGCILAHFVGTDLGKRSGYVREGGGGRLTDADMERYRIRVYVRCESHPGRFYVVLEPVG
jgi:hypothetical protein